MLRREGHSGGRRVGRRGQHVPAPRLVAFLLALFVLACLGGCAYLLFRTRPEAVAERPLKGGPLRVEQGVCPSALQNTEYGGDVLKWGEHHVLEDAGACCAACAALRPDTGPRCSAWVFCDGATGCGSRAHGECWLKASQHPAKPIVAAAGESVFWTSGALFSADEAATAAAVAKAEGAALNELRYAPGNKRAYLEVSIAGGPPLRMEFMLFLDVAPRGAANFMAFARGDTKDKNGRTRTWVGARFYRILDLFIDQTGVDGIDTIHGGLYDDDAGGLSLKHDRPGLLSQGVMQRPPSPARHLQIWGQIMMSLTPVSCTANSGRNTNSNHFSILMAPAPHLNGAYTIFGELVLGAEHATAINKLASASGSPTKAAIIVGAGEL